MSKKSKKIKKGAKVNFKSVKRRYVIAVVSAVLIIILVLFARNLVASQQVVSTKMNITPTPTQASPTVTITPTRVDSAERANTPGMKLRKTTAIPTPTVKPTSSNTTTNSQSPTATPQPTPTPSLPTLTAQNGAEFTFQVGYDSQYGYTPPAPNYDSSYLQFLYSAVTNPNYKPGDRVDEEFHFKALKTGETTLEVTRRDSTTKYRVVIQ